MSYFQDFPNTNFYNQDLGWLINKYKELLNTTDKLLPYYENLNQEINNIANEVIIELLNENKLIVKPQLVLETRLITFNLGGEE